MSRRHTHPVYVGENNAPEPPEVPIPIAQNQPQPIEVAHVNLANEQELQLAPVERIDDVVGNEEIDELMPGDQIDVACEVEVANQIDPNVQMALDFQMAQDLHLAFTLEMEDFVAIQEKPPRKVRRPRTNSAVELFQVQWLPSKHSSRRSARMRRNRFYLCRLHISLLIDYEGKTRKTSVSMYIT